MYLLDIRCRTYHRLPNIEIHFIFPSLFFASRFVKKHHKTHGLTIAINYPHRYNNYVLKNSSEAGQRKYTVDIAGNQLTMFLRKHINFQIDKLLNVAVKWMKKT